MTINKYNPETLFPPYRNYSHAVEVRDDSRILFISGLNGYQQDGKTMPDSFEEQCEVIWGYIGEVLNSANMDYDNIIFVRTYLAHPEDRDTNTRLRLKFLGDNEPALTTISCQLLETKWKLELEAIAAI